MTKKRLNPLEDPPAASSSDEDEVEAPSGDDEEEHISNDSSSDEEDDLLNPVNIPSAKDSQSEKPIAIPKPKANDIGGSPAVKKRPIEITTSVSAKRAKTTKKPSSSSQRLWSEEDEISVLQGMIDFKADTGKSPYEEMDRFYELTSKTVSYKASKIQFMDKIRHLKRKYMERVKDVESLTKAHDIECLKLANYIWGSHGMALNPNVKKLESAAKSKGTPKESENKSVKSKGTPKKSEKKSVKSKGTPKKSERKPVSVEANGDNVEEDREVLVGGDNGGKDREVLVGGGDNGGEDRDLLANNGDKDKEEVLINGRGASKSGGVMRASDWFEDSFLVGSITGLGVSERFVKEKWSMVTVETKKRMEEKWKLLQAKEMELVLHKTDFMREIGSVIAEAS